MTSGGIPNLMQQQCIKDVFRKLSGHPKAFELVIDIKTPLLIFAEASVTTGSLLGMALRKRECVVCYLRKWRWLQKCRDEIAEGRNHSHGHPLPPDQLGLGAFLHGSTSLIAWGGAARHH